MRAVRPCGAGWRRRGRPRLSAAGRRGTWRAFSSAPRAWRSRPPSLRTGRQWAPPCSARAPSPPPTRAPDPQAPFSCNHDNGVEIKSRVYEQLLIV